MSPMNVNLGQLKAVVDELQSFDPQASQGEPVRFSRLVDEFPSRLNRKTPSVPVVGMANFSEMAYCGYKPWHHAVGTEEVRIAAVQRALDRGTRVHERKVTVELKEAAKLPRATARHLRDLRIDIYRLPELPARIRVGRLTYASRIERAGRQGGDLVITEIKTGNYVFTPDHFLQVWGYAASAPGSLLHWTRRAFRARSVLWSLEYPTRGATYGPYPFTKKQLHLLRRAMSFHEQVYLMGRSGVREPGMGLHGPSERKCPPCAFSHACQWRYRETNQATLTVALDGGPRVSEGQEALSQTSPSPSYRSASALPPGPSPAARPPEVER